MFRYRDYYEEKKDACETCEAQKAYICAYALNYACLQIGK